MKRLKVTVTQEDIDEGERGECSRCPIALAIKRVFSNTFVSVNGADARVEEVDGRRRWYSLSKSAREFIASFDSDGKIAVKPATFVLTPSDYTS
jgi:hypothetical protein